VKRSDGASLWGQIKIQDDPHSEAIHTMTKFCSDPEGVLPERARTRDFHLLHRGLNSVLSPEQTKAQKSPLFPPNRVS
jgi:hypothetical protein